ncbi:hypothetical protein ACFW9L_43155 [Streptomyces sp. NPDC059517]|uniref:hypothetical protein n=1 Tax=Streptomyces sp. NPDC059517 TaxID=3346855 RepID=UPI003683CAC9
MAGNPGTRSRRGGDRASPALRHGLLCEGFPAGGAGAWLSGTDLDVWAGEFERIGITGALNRLPHAPWTATKDFAPHCGAPIAQSSLFIGGALDAPTTWTAAASGHWA